MTRPLRSTHRPWRTTPLIAALALAGLPTARAASIQVGTPDDPAGTAATCTLRQAIAAMNAASAAGSGCTPSGAFGSNDTVSFAAGGRNGSAGANTLTLADLATSTLSISAHDLTLMGMDANAVGMTVRRPAGAANAFGILYDSAPASGSLTVIGMTLANGNVPGPAGTPATCSGAANYGGGISMKNGAALSLYASTISGNTAKWGGGGVFSEGDITLFGSTISGNSTQHSGGGLFGCERTGALQMANSTISGNTASQWGGGIGFYHSRGNVAIANSTIATNSVGAGWYGAGIALRNAYASATVRIDNTIISGNLVGAGANSKLASVVVGNFIGGTPPMPIAGVANLVHQGTAALDPSQSYVSFATAPITTNPLLAALADNGGPTRTMLPQAGSPAINAADFDVCVNGATNSIDQRSLPRPSPAGGQCDIGAVEVQAAQSYALTVAVQGPGSVGASGTQPAAPPDPGSIAGCTSMGGASCTASFVAGTAITLTATPPQPSGYTVTWGGACTAAPGNPLQASAALSSAATCTVNIVSTGASTWTVSGNGEPATLASAACDAGAHTCPTLRDAINTALSGDSIVFDASLDNATISLALYSNPTGCVTSNATACSGGGTLGRQFGPSAFFIDGRAITIDATALAHGVTIARDAAAANFRLFDIAPGSGLALRGLMLSGGVAKGGQSNFGGGGLGAGGAIFTRGQVDIERCTFSGNAAFGGDSILGSVSRGGGGVGNTGATGNPGGGPNGGLAGANVVSGAGGVGSNGGFGGGGGGGGSAGGSGVDAGNGGNGGNGGFGGAGAQGGLSSGGNYGNGGNGGFGGGGGGGGSLSASGMPGFGGGVGVAFGGGGAGLGGAIFNDAGTLSIRNSTLVGNSAAGGNAHQIASGQGSAFGGAIFNYNGVLTLDASTLTDNTVQQGTGGMAGSLGGTAVYSLGDGSCNTAGSGASGGNVCAGTTATLTMNMSVAARSQGSLKDVTLDRINGGASTASGAGNFIAYTQALNGTNTNSLVTINPLGIHDPQLAITPAANGGFGLTLMPLPGSPLIDPAPGGSCSGVALDQRGFARPQGTLCDIGAVEVRGPRITVDVTTPGGAVTLASPASLAGLGLVNCSPQSPDYCSTRASGEDGPPDVTLHADTDSGYHVASVSSDCGATFDASYSRIRIAALAADCTVHVAFAANVVGGSVQNLAGSSLVLHLDPGDGGSGEDLPVAAGAASFAFAAPVSAGNDYAVTIAAQPDNPSQACLVANGSGRMPAADVSSVVVACTTNAYAIGGSVTGLAASGLQLALNGGAPFAIAADGAFAFPTPLTSGSSYVAAIVAQPIGQDCALANGSGHVADADVTSIAVTCIAAQPVLAASVAAGSLYARYGQVVDDVFTLANNGNATAHVAVAITLDAAFDGDNAHVACLGAGGGATCTPDAANPLLYAIALPPGRSLVWLVGAPVRSDAADATASIVLAAGAATGIDTRTLVIYRDGFDVPYGDGTQLAPVAGADAKAVLDGDALREVRVPSTTGSAVAPLLTVTDGVRELRVEACRAAGSDFVRLIERDGAGRERASAWSETRPGAALALGSTEGDASSGDGMPRAIVLSGTPQPVALR